MFIRLLFFTLTGMIPFLTHAQSEQNWVPQKDEVYLQEISTQIHTDDPVTDIIANQDIAFALIKDQLYQVKNQEITPAQNAPAGIKKLFQEQDIIMAAAQDGLFE